LPEIDYLTKGQRDKRFPIGAPLGRLWGASEGATGLLFVRRNSDTKNRKVPLYGMSLTQLIDEFHRRCRAQHTPSADERHRIREELIRDAGGMNYDYIQHEFQSIARKLSWPPAATLKDFRHLFSTCLENSGVPEFYRRYFMGQSPGKTPIVTYTHLNELHGQFAKALENGLAPLVAAVSERESQLNVK
jgi:integrase